MPNSLPLLSLLFIFATSVTHSQSWQDVTPVSLPHRIHDVQSIGPYLGLSLHDTFYTPDREYNFDDFAFLDSGVVVYANNAVHDSGGVHHTFVIQSNGVLLDWISYEPTDTLHGAPHVWSVSNDLSQWTKLETIGIDTEKYAPSQQRMFQTFDNKVIHFGERNGPLVTLNNGVRWYPSTLNDIIYASVSGAMPLITGYLDRGETIFVSHGLYNGDTQVKQVPAIAEIDKFTGDLTPQVDGLAGTYVFGCARSTNGLIVSASATIDNDTKVISALAVSAYNPETYLWSTFLWQELSHAELPVDVTFDKKGRCYIVAGGIDSIYVVDPDLLTVGTLPLPPSTDLQTIQSLCVHNDKLYAANGLQLFVWDQPVTGIQNSEFRIATSNCEHRNTVKYDVLGRVITSVEYSGAYYEVCKCGKAALKYR